MPWGDLGHIGPELTLVIAAFVVLLWDAWATGPRLDAPRGPATTWVAVIGVGVALALNAGLPADPLAFGGMYVRDRLTQSITLAALASAGLGVLMAPGYLRRFGLPQGEYYALVLFCAAGAILMGASRNLVVLFLGLEILSFPLYTLAGLAARSTRSQEAGLKYLLLGAFATAFFVYGIALIYGATGTLDLGGLRTAALTPLLGTGIALLTIGLAFEAALVPFHAWAPDVYEGAPLPATAFMSVAAKIGAFGGLLRVFPLALPHLSAVWVPVLVAISIATMVLGNLAALFQTNLKRLLAYSGIAHAGYLLIGVASPADVGAPAVLYYLVVYTVMNLGAFGVLLLLERRGEEADRLEDLVGLFWRAPWAGSVLVVCVASLAGLPPTGGFLAKLYLFRAALAGGQTALAIVAVLTSVVSVYYYFRIAFAAMSVGAPDGVAVRPSFPVGVGLAVTGAGVLWLGIFPSGLWDFVQQAVLALR